MPIRVPRTLSKWMLVVLLALTLTGLAMVSGTDRALHAAQKVTVTPGAPLAGPPAVVTRNTDWTPVIRTFDGVEMALVPPGCFMMGTADWNWAGPPHEVCFDQPFWIDSYEVTNEQFEQLGGHPASQGQWTDADRPRERIDWFEARDFCSLRGARLPTEAEWEYAARGPDGLIHPWGDKFVADNVVYWENSGEQTAIVGSRPGGVSWVGAMDLSGNVWEWVSSLYEPYPYRADDGREADTGTSTDVLRVLRGGSWVGYEQNVRATVRLADGPEDRNANIGFRCARGY
jgi:formylglycine-generating enzyme required for sulfatase activity